MKRCGVPILDDKGLDEKPAFFRRFELPEENEGPEANQS